MISSKQALTPSRKSSWRSRGFFLWAFLPLLFSCAGNHYTLRLVSNEPTESLAESPLKILVASDLHYLEPSLSDNGALFTKTTTDADAKLTAYSGQILAAFLAKVKEAKPDALFLTGDLTFNGEKLSHESLASFLKELTALGIAVLVIPGNHDIASDEAYSYAGDHYQNVANVSPNEFLKIYAEVSYQKAISFDELSLSYVYPLRKDAWVLALSADGDPSERGIIPTSTEKWIVEELKKAKEAGAHVYSLTHESLLLQNENFVSSLIHNAGEVASLLMENGVIGNSSGHLHIQHYAEKKALVDIATSSLLVAPFHYGEIDWDATSLSYHSQNLDVSSYAKSVGWSDPHLLDLTNYGKEFFYRTNETRIRSRLEGSGYSDLDKEAMVQSYLQLNYDYYQGLKTDETLYPTGYALWKASNLSFSRYVKSMMACDDQDFNSYRKSF
jgi:3',5'-cyclic AMP phosphodiesterase CpdA